KWSPTKVPVDNMNTLYASPFAIVGLRSSFALTETVSIYGEARNIFDKTYASSVVTTDKVMLPSQAMFLPGDGRAFYAGIKARF
ncbi:MAG: TonB-dependent receptor, partial [Rhodospirillaceae bacterium]|nr:TonB-dependent receptor [Rhodospirillaceae bacterium]